MLAQLLWLLPVTVMRKYRGLPVLFSTVSSLESFCPEVLSSIVVQRFPSPEPSSLKRWLLCFSHRMLTVFTSTGRPMSTVIFSPLLPLAAHQRVDLSPSTALSAGLPDSSLVAVANPMAFPGSGCVLPSGIFPKRANFQFQSRLSVLVAFRGAAMRLAMLNAVMQRVVRVILVNISVILRLEICHLARFLFSRIRFLPVLRQQGSTRQAG